MRHRRTIKSGTGGWQIKQTGLLIIFAASLAWGVLAAGQHRPAASQASTDIPILRRTTRLVELSVVAHDSRGKLVTDLKREDFTVLDEGTAQEIGFFRADAAASEPWHEAESPHDDQFTNRLDQRRRAPPSVTILLLDALNTRMQDHAFARQEVLRFLETLRADDRVALYALGNGVSVLHDFTSDPVRLRRAALRYRGRNTAELDASNPADPAPLAEGETKDDVARIILALDAVQERMANFYVAERVRRTTEAIEAIANRVAPIPGRKNLIWVSGSFPLSYGELSEMSTFNLSPDRRSFYKEAERAARALNTANLVIYPVDARGLVASGYDPNFRAGRRFVDQAPSAPDMKVDSSYRDAMILLAHRTGGVAYYDTNDLAGAVRRAVDDSAFTYTMAYYPNHNRWLGEWREIKVKVNRPDIRLRHRRGYYAMPDLQRGGPDRFVLTLAAASSPAEATGLGITIRPEFVDSARTVLKINVEVDSQTLQLQRQANNRFAGAVDLAVAQFDAVGTRLRYVLDTLAMNFQTKTYTSMRAGGFEFSKTVKILPEAIELRVAIRDLGSGHVGSVVIPLNRVQFSASKRK